MPTMNLSCANCRVVRPFSGDPLRCEVCRWPLNSPAAQQQWQSLRKERDTKWNKAARFINILFISILIGFLSVAGIAIAIEYFKPDQDKLAEQYRISRQNVFIEPQPHGCEFNDAPLGEKHCHFEKDVNVVRECERPNCNARAVYVSWRKVSD